MKTTHKLALSATASTVVVIIAFGFIFYYNPSLALPVVLSILATIVIGLACFFIFWIWTSFFEWREAIAKEKDKEALARLR